jgi:hypothetical protein
MNRKIILTLLGIVALGIVVRVMKFDYGLPGFFVPDTQTISEAMDIGNAVTSKDWSLFSVPQKYPLITPYLILFLHGIAFAAGKVLGLFSDISSFLRYIALNQEYSFLLARGLSVLAGTSIIFLSFVCAKLLAQRFRAGNPNLTGLIAATLSSFSLLLVHFSIFERPHILMGAATLLSYYCYLKFLESSSVKYTVFLTIAVGLAAGTLQSGMLALIFLLAAAWHLIKNRAGNLRKIVLALMFLLLIFFLSYPALFLSPLQATTTGEGGFDITFSGGLHESSPFEGQGYAKIIYNLFVYDPVILVLAVISLGFLVWKGRLKEFWKADQGALLSYVFLFIIIFGLRNDHPPRFDIPLLIFLIIFSSVIIPAIAELIKGRTRGLKTAIFSVLFYLVLLAPIIQVFRLTYLMQQPDTRELVSQYVLHELPQNAVLIENNALLTIPPTKDSLAVYNKFSQTIDRREKLLLSLSDQEYPKNARTYLKSWKLPQNNYPELVKETQASYLIISHDQAFYGASDALTEYAEDNFMLQKKFSPFEDEQQKSYSVFPADFHNPLYELWSQKNLGPEIRVYQRKN